jgi:hypothetical protein
VILFAIAFSVSGQVAQAQTACDASVLKGNYSFNLTGSFYDAQGYWYVMALVGMSNFDGAGNFSGTDAISLDGTIKKRKITGTYTVDTDCTGTIKIVGSDDITFNGNIVVNDKGNNIDFIDTDANVIFSGVIKKQNPVTTSTTTPPASE